MSNHREIFLETLETSNQLISQEFDRISWEQKPIYINWLCQTYHYVARTTRLIAFASSRTPLNEDRWHWRFIQEAKEEKSHEKLILEDLRKLNAHLTDFPELPYTSFFYQTLHYMIEFYGPKSLLGYSLTLEGLAAKGLIPIWKRIETHYGEKGTSFLKLHCEVDVDHYRNAIPLLDHCKTSDFAGMIQAAEQCRTIYLGILNSVSNTKEEILQSYSQNEVAKNLSVPHLQEH